MKATLLLALFVAAIALVSAKVYYQEEFTDDDALTKRWVQSEATGKEWGKVELSSGDWYGSKKADRGLKTTQDARFYALSSKFDEVLPSNKDKTLVLQFSAKHEQGIDCGGGYVKILPSSVNQKEFTGDSPYNVMFGPDICGSSKKIHFIFGYKGKNLLWKKTPPCETDKLTHLYTAIVYPNNTYEVLVDQKQVEKGSLLEDWDFLEPKTIADPEDKKPADWVDSAEMTDPEDKKPADWDDAPEYIPDPSAKKPEDWDDEEDGEWETPKIKNPEYKGEWKARRIPNPAYKGPWKARDIPNPKYVADDEVYVQKDMGLVGFDLWQVKSGTIFDNIIVTDDVEEAKALAEKTFVKYAAKEKAMYERLEEEKKKKDEEERKKKEEEEEKKKKEAETKKDDSDEEIVEKDEL